MGFEYKKIKIEFLYLRSLWLKNFSRIEELKTYINFSVGQGSQVVKSPSYPGTFGSQVQYEKNFIIRIKIISFFLVNKIKNCSRSLREPNMRHSGFLDFI